MRLKYAKKEDNLLIITERDNTEFYFDMEDFLTLYKMPFIRSNNTYNYKTVCLCLESLAYESRSDVTLYLYDKKAKDYIEKLSIKYN